MTEEPIQKIRKALNEMDTLIAAATPNAQGFPPSAPLTGSVSEPERGRGEWRTTINQFSPTADIRTQVFDGDKIICADLMHIEADAIVKEHNLTVRAIRAEASRRQNGGSELSQEAK